MWLNTKQAAAHAGVNIKTLRNWTREGLQHYRLSNNLVRIADTDIDAYIRRFKSGIDVDAEVAAIMTKIRRGK